MKPGPTFAERRRFGAKQKFCIAKNRGCTHLQNKYLEGPSSEYKRKNDEAINT